MKLNPEARSKTGSRVGNNQLHVTFVRCHSFFAGWNLECSKATWTRVNWERRDLASVAFEGGCGVTLIIIAHDRTSAPSLSCAAPRCFFQPQKPPRPQAERSWAIAAGYRTFLNAPMHVKEGNARYRTLALGHGSKLVRSVTACRAWPATDSGYRSPCVTRN